MTDRNVTRKLVEIGDTHYALNKRIEVIRRLQ